MTANEKLKIRSLEALVDTPHFTANLANAAAFIFHETEKVSWCGFYIAEGETLVLGPFCGKPACVEIPFGKGVCGTAAKFMRTVAVPDVHAFPGHIACDADSRSEIVVPIIAGGRVAAVLDIDSAEKGRFTAKDAPFFEEIAKTVAQLFV